MSHFPRECDHCWTSWTSAIVTNEVGEQAYQLERWCTICRKVQTEHGAIIEPRDAA